MKATTNYNLPLYEPNDLANLTDGYNNGMEILDTSMKAVEDFVQTYDKAIEDNAAAIATETSRATAAENTNADAISAEATRAEAAEKTNADAISAEVSRATAAEKANADAISKINNDLTEKINNFSCYKSVYAYGISADNEDNADLFQNALEDTASKGYVLYIPNGTYKMSHSVNIPWYCSVVGQSKSGTIIKFSSDKGFGCATDKNGYKTCVGSTITNMTIEGSYSGYNALIYDQKWYSKSSDTQYMTDFAGIGGFFTSCKIDHVNVRNFVYGVSLYQEVPTGDYNNLYNNVYGDLRRWTNINVAYCNSGFACNQWDTMVDGLDVNHCYNLNPVIMNGGHLSNVHTWGTNKYMYIKGPCLLSNIEIEAQYSYTAEDKTTTHFDGCILFENASNSVASVSNLRIWNLMNETVSGTYQSLLRITKASTQNLAITGFTVGANPEFSNPANYPTTFLTCTGAVNVYLQGTVHNSIQTIYNKTDGYIFYGSNCSCVSFMLSKNNFSKNAIIPTEFNNVQIAKV